jgi:hypothetical protein
MKPAAQVIHQTKERTRLQVLEKRRDEEYFSITKKQLEELQGIELVKTNPLSCSIVLQHPESTHKDILADIEKLNIFDLKKAGDTPQSTGGNLGTVFDALTGFERGFLGQTQNIQPLLFVLLVGLAIRQALRGEIMAPAIPLLRYALDFALNASTDQAKTNL